MKRRAAGTVLSISIFGLLLAGCANSARNSTSAGTVSSPSSVSSPPPPWSYPCTTGVGEGCGPPQPITHPLWTDGAGRTISGRFLCGGALFATETAAQVALTFTQQVMMPGAMACAGPILTARLTSSLGTRTVIDATTGARLSVGSTPPASPWAMPTAS